MPLGLAYLATVVLVALQTAFFYGQLPPLVASHFGADGVANGFMNRDGFVEFYLGLVAFLGVLFGLLSRGLASVPPAIVNIPNRDYWLAPERQKESLVWLSRQLSGFGLLLILFLAAIMQLVFVANTEGGLPVMPPKQVGLFVAALLVAGAVFTLRLLFHFRRPP